MAPKSIIHISDVPITAMLITTKLKILDTDKNPYPLPDFLVSCKCEDDFYTICINNLGITCENLLMPLMYLDEDCFPRCEKQLEELGCKVILRVYCPINKLVGFCGWKKDPNEVEVKTPDTLEELQKNWKEWVVIKEM